MIGTIDIKVNAAHPNMPLMPIYAHIGSPSQVRIINVPKSIGKWAVTAVQITANYPDNTSRSVAATLVGGCWSATLPASTAVGQSLMGFKVTASGTDESGVAVTGYVLGKGDVFILNDDSTITIGSTTYYVHLLDSQPTYPHKGDLCIVDGVWKIYNGTTWVALGGGGGDVKHSDFADMAADLNPDESSMGDVMTKVNTLIAKLKGATAAIVALLALGSFAAVEVQTAKLATLPGKTMIVTNIVGAAATSDLVAATNTLTSTITNKADKSDLEGCLPKSGGAMTGDLVFNDPDGGRHLTIGFDGIIRGEGEGSFYLPNRADDGTIAMIDNIPTSFPWASVTGKPNTLAGYGITDTFTKIEADGRYLQLSGGEITGNLTVGTGESYPKVVVGRSEYQQDGIFTKNSWLSFPEYKNDTIALLDDLPTASSLRAVTYAADAPEAHKTAVGILSTAENTAGTKIDRGYTPTNAVVKLSRSVQYVLNPAAVTIQVPDTIPNGIRDWVVYVQNTSLTDTIPLTLPISVSWYAADKAYTNACTKSKMTALYFTEITTNKFAIGRAELDLL